MICPKTHSKSTAEQGREPRPLWAHSQSWPAPLTSVPSPGPSDSETLRETRGRWRRRQQGWGQGTESRSRSETTKWGRLTKPEFASWLALGKAPATYSQWKAGSSMCPEAGQAQPQKPLEWGFSSADITQAGPAEPPAPQYQPMCEFGLTVQFGGLFHKDKDVGMLKSH